MKRTFIALLFAGCAAPASGIHEMTATGHARQMMWWAGDVVDIVSDNPGSPEAAEVGRALQRSRACLTWPSGSRQRRAAPPPIRRKSICNAESRNSIDDERSTSGVEP